MKLKVHEYQKNQLKSVRKNFLNYSINTCFVILFCLLSVTKLIAQTTTLNGPTGSEKFGERVYSLPNGNFVVTDPFFDDGAFQNAGAVYLYNGQTKQLISTLKGEKTGDVIGFDGIEILTNGNFLVKSQGWQNGSLQSCGAITWVNGTTGLNGVVNQTNSLVGTKENDRIASGGIFLLPNGNYIVCSKRCDNGSAIDAGAVTWGNGTTGTVGFVTISNSVMGNATGDYVGDQSGMDVRTDGIVILSNGNFVIRSIEWDNAGIVDVGAVTWVNGTTGLAGTITATNSLIGTTADDKVGRDGVTTLINGNYVVVSSVWDNGSIVNAGAATWCNGTTGLTGFISSSNSLVGDGFSMLLGSQGVFALTNGNYVVCTSSWYDLTAIGRGAVTFCNGATGRIGLITTSNSLVGNVEDRIGINGIAVLPNGNYVVKSLRWSTFRGATTWCNGTTGQTIDNLPISANNSLIGQSVNDNVGFVDVLPNSNYVVRTASFKNGAINGAGSVTLCNGTLGNTVGIVNSNNSILGQKADDAIGATPITVLTNGNFVLSSHSWDNVSIVNVGAITHFKGTFITGQPSPTSGLLTGNNSLIGSTANDMLGATVGGLFSDKRKPVTALTDGNYVVISPLWSNGGVANVGAVTLGNGITGISGTVNSSNSLIGSSVADLVGNDGVIPLDNGNYVVNSKGWDFGAISNAGAVTFCSGNTPTVGIVNSTNSLILNATYNSVSHNIESVANNMYMIKGQDPLNFNYGTTIVSAATGIRGFLDPCNSVFPINNEPSNSYNAVNNYLVVGIAAQNKAIIFNPQSQILSPINTSNTNVILGAGTINFVDVNCKLITSLLANGANPISGNTTAKVWIQTTQPAQYAKRHYEITPTTNPLTATGKVTLYFTQQEFDDFNAINTIDFPTSPTDNAGIANILIEKRGGISSNNSGMPTTYSGAITNINPTDSDIVWNSSESRWEISFNVTGFSGFFLRTTSSLSSNEFDTTKNQIIVYPNPVADILKIESNSKMDAISVFNLLGQEILNKKANDLNSEIDVLKFSKGTYFLKIYSDNKEQILKFLKK